MSAGVNLTDTPGNHSVKAELDIEGTFQGTADSRVTVPTVVPPPPVISSISPASGFPGTSVTVTGINFGTPQGTSTIKFNNVVASPSNWSATSILVDVPANASSGPVVVTVAGAPSNQVTFSVFTTGTLAGTITRVTGGTPVSGALVEALQSGVVKTSATTTGAGTYSFGGLTSGSYDVRVSASGLLTELRPGNAVGNGATTTVNVSLAVAGSITGRITQANGTTPIAGAGVSVLQGTATAGTTVANGNGDFSIGGLAPGTYSVEASAISYVPKTQTGVSVTESSSATVNLSLDAASASAIRYEYDALGRLIAVVDLSGETATFAYDMTPLAISPPSADRPRAPFRSSTLCRMAVR